MSTNYKLRHKAFARFGLVTIMLTTAILSSALGQSVLPNYEQKIVKEDPNRVFNVTEKLPSFPGGANKMMEFLGQNIRYPAADRENNVQGKVVATFVVERDGSLTNIKIIRSPSKDMTKETERVLALSPKWNPGMQNGKPVRAEYNLPVSFTLSKG